ncbi:MAG TPA: hypothetical protein VH413_02645 [Verrucomicrobiae bacterium]|jgi:hypothetical protein|nr:hypothetical protein [Verrucomicrobiae bacterium]
MNWNQLSTILWLRWRLTRNQFARAGKFNAVLAIIGVVFMVCLIIGAGIGGFIGGMTGLPELSPTATMLAWDSIVCVFLFFWMLGVLVELQRSESIDLARMLHLPVSLAGIFVMNFVASHFTLGIIFFLPMLIGLCAGLVWAKGMIMLLLFPLMFSFIFLVSAWTYCLRGWLISLMVNPRRRRTVMGMLTLAIVLAGQLPNLYIHFFLPKHMKQMEQKIHDAPAQANGAAKWEQAVPEGLTAAQDYVPVFWLPRGAMGLATGDVLPAMLGTAAGFLLGIAGLARAYRSTVRFYRGQDTSGTVQAKPLEKKTGITRGNFLERDLPFVAEESAGMALAFFRSLTRAPEVRITLFSNFVLLLVFVPMMLFRFSQTASETARLFYATGAVGFTFFGMLPLMFNVFGYDRDGFRSLVLSPAARKNVLLAKNISMMPIVFGLGGGMLVVFTVMVHLGGMAVAASVLKLGAVFILMCIAGNWISICVPYRITAGSLKPTKPPIKVVLLMMLTQMLYPLVMLPIFLAPLLGFLSSKMGWWPGPLVDGIVSAGLLGIAMLLYVLTFNSLGELLEQREQRILLTVTREGE